MSGHRGLIRKLSQNFNEGRRCHCETSAAVKKKDQQKGRSSSCSPSKLPETV
jgi:hypothetical protein